MKPKFAKTSNAALGLIVLSTFSASAADRVRNSTATNLIDDAAWTTTPAPTSADRAVWISSSAGGAQTLGGNASWGGISIGSQTPNPGVTFTNAANPTAYTLTLGADGIDLNNGNLTNRGITFESNTSLALGANQTWKLGNGATTTANITVSSVISGSGSLEVTRDAASNNLLQLNGANTFSGGFTLGANAVVTIGTAAVVSGGNTTSSALGSYDGNQFLTINGGRINSGNFAFHARDAKIGGDFTFASSARTEFGGSYDLQDGSRTMTLTRSATAANTVIQGGNVALRFSLDSNSTSFSNGTLRLAADAGTPESNFVPVIANFGTAFVDNAGLTLGSKVIYSAGTGNLNVANAVPSVTLEAGSYWNLAEGANVRNPQVNSLAGAGTVLSAGTATAGTAFTLTIRGNSGSVSDFSGSVIDADTTTFATSTAGIVGVTKEGSTTQIFSGTNTYTGATNVNNGKLVINGSISTSSLTSVATGATLGGSGTVGATTINGILAPGNSIGTLTATGDVTWNSNNAWLFELGLAASTLEIANTTAGLSDMLNITGDGNDFLKGTGDSFTFDFAGGGTEGWYKLVDWTSATDFAAEDFVTSNLASGLSGTFTVDSETSALYLNVVPEPSTTLLAGIGILALMRRRR